MPGRRSTTVVRSNGGTASSARTTRSSPNATCTSLALRVERWIARRRSAGSAMSVWSAAPTGATKLPSVPVSPRWTPTGICATSDREGSSPRSCEVAPQRTGAHRERHVVHGHAERIRDGPDVGHRHRSERDLAARRSAGGSTTSAARGTATSRCRDPGEAAMRPRPTAAVQREPASRASRPGAPSANRTASPSSPAVDGADSLWS